MVLDEKGGDVYVIQTESFGRCAIWAPRDNDSSITSTPAYSNGGSSGGGSTGGGTGGVEIPGGLKVFIDPGHGGSDPGASGNGLQEKDMVLSISKKLGVILNSYGISVKYSRETDTFINLDPRAQQANSWGASLFVSIHANSATASASGTECFTKPATDSKTNQLSANVAQSISSKLGIPNRGHKEEVWRVLMSSNMPAILVETAFITNSGDASLLKNRPDDFANAVATQILSYLNVSIEQPTSLGLIKDLTQLAVRYCYESSLSGFRNVNKCVLDYLRHIPYNSDEWIQILGELSPFVKYVTEKNTSFHNKIYKYINGSTLMIVNRELIDMPHLAATILGYTNDILGTPLSLAVPNFWTGWGGDLATAMSDVTRLKLENYPSKAEQVIAEDYVIGNTFSSFSKEDIYADIDAVDFAEKFTTTRFDISFEEYYNSVTSKKRKEIILTKDFKLLSTSSEKDVSYYIKSLMVGLQGFNYPLVGSKLKGKATYNDKSPTNLVIDATCNAFAKYIVSL